ncbi:MAG: NAD(P)-dependent oxidoreductase, partial [Desulfobacula sp.]|nr:NAD(P)-dependent oxidoreductase [Desulfobacula sp.]
MKIGFIGLGNVGGKLAGSLLRNGFDLMVRDLDDVLVQSFIDQGATTGASPKEIAENVDLIITCLPSPAACSKVMESEDGVIAGISKGKIWLEMSTTDEAEIVRLAKLLEAKGAMAMD